MSPKDEILKVIACVREIPVADKDAITKLFLGNHSIFVISDLPERSSDTKREKELQKKVGEVHVLQLGDKSSLSAITI